MTCGELKTTADSPSMTDRGSPIGLRAGNCRVGFDDDGRPDVLERLADKPALVGAGFRHELHQALPEVGNIEIARRIDAELMAPGEIAGRRSYP